MFNERCFIGFESDETLVYRLWDVFQDVAIWSSDYPHHDAEDAWDGLHHMAEFNVPAAAQQKLLGENARTLYGIEPLMAVKERIEDVRARDPALVGAAGQTSTRFEDGLGDDARLRVPHFPAG